MTIHRFLWFPLVALTTAGWIHAAAAAMLHVTVDGVRSADGAVIVAVHDDARTFPGDWANAVAVARVPAMTGSVTVVFDGLNEGRRAVIAVHDADGNGAMTKTILGLPREGFGTSNDPTFWGPPRFRWAVFDLADGGAVRIRLVYP